MGQIPEKTYTAPDGSVYRVESDGSVTKIKCDAEQQNFNTDKKIVLEKTYQVILDAPGKQKLLVVKTIVELSKHSLKSAKSIVDNAPSIIAENVSESEALNLKSKFDEIGASVSISSMPDNTRVLRAEGDNKGYIHKKNNGCLGELLLIISTIVSLLSF